MQHISKYAHAWSLEELEYQLFEMPVSWAVTKKQQSIYLYQFSVKVFSCQRCFLLVMSKVSFGHGIFFDLVFTSVWVISGCAGRVYHGKLTLLLDTIRKVLLVGLLVGQRVSNLYSLKNTTWYYLESTFSRTKSIQYRPFEKYYLILFWEYSYIYTSRYKDGKP